MITKGLGSGVCLMLKGMGILWKFSTVLLNLLSRNLLFSLDIKEKTFRMKKRTVTMSVDNRFVSLGLNPRSTMFHL